MKGIVMLIESFFGHHRQPCRYAPPPGGDVSKAIQENLSAMHRSVDVAKSATENMRKTMLPINELMQRISEGNEGGS